MGNTPSSEASRKPHKLTKPRVVGKHASTAGLSSYQDPAAAGYGGATRFSNSYLVGSVPISPPGRPSIEPSQIGIAIAGAGEDAQSSSMPTRRSSRRDLIRMPSLFRSKSYHNEQAARKKNRISGPVPGSTKTSRANSLTPNVPRPHVRANSLQSNPKRGSVNNGMGSYEAQRLLDLENGVSDDPSVPPVPPIPHSIGHPQVQEVTENTWKTAHPAAQSQSQSQSQPQPSNDPITRTNSDLSLYTTMRRRSFAQTPGVATRPQMPPRQISARSANRKSHPSTPSDTRHNSLDSAASRPMSMPTINHVFELPPIATELTADTVATPSDGEYRQLGAIAFGSLRIMNGTPVSAISRGEEDEKKESYSPTKSVELCGDSPTSLESDESIEETTIQIAQPQPIFRVTSPITTTFVSTETAKRVSLQTCATATGLADIRERSPNATPRAQSPALGLEVRSKQTADEDRLFDDDAEYSTLEVLDVRDDPNAKPTPEAIQHDLEQKRLGSMSRTDSGYIGSPSSEAPRKPLSKADSGYSSNFSLRSVYGSRASSNTSRLSSGRSNSDRSEPRRSAELRRCADGKREEEGKMGVASIQSPAPSPKDEPSTPRRPSLTSLSRNSFTRLRSLRKGKSRDSSSLSSTSSSSDGQGVSGNGTKSAASSYDKTSVALNSSHSAPHGKFHRLLGPTKKKGPPRVQNAYNIGNPPAYDYELSDVEDNGRPLAFRRRTLRAEPSRGTLATILSVGSGDLLNGDASPQIEEKAPLPDVKDAKPRSPLRSFHSASQSLRTAAAALLASTKQEHGNAPSRKVSFTTTEIEVAVHKTHSVTAMDTSTSENIWEYEATATSVQSIQRTLGQSAFDQAFAASRAERVMASKAVIRPQFAKRTERASFEALRQRASTPEFQGTALRPMSPAVPALSGKPKSPPPVSMQTRGSKKSKKNRHTPPRRPRSTPPGTARDGTQAPQLQRSYSGESMQNYPRPSGTYQPLDGYMIAVAMNSPTSPRRVGNFGHQKAYGQPAPSFAAPNSRNGLGSSSHRRAPPVHQTSPQFGTARQDTFGSSSNPQQTPALRHRSSTEGQNHLQPYPPPYYSSQPQQYDSRQVIKQQAQARSRPLPTPPSPQHCRTRSTGSTDSHHAQPPYRVLHSYNSPAYRGAPIWG